MKRGLIGVFARHPTAANLLMAAAEGRIHQYCRSDFRRLPSEGWTEQWSVLIAELMTPVTLPQN